MDYFAVKNTVDEDKKAILTKFIQDVYSDPDFKKFMSGLAMQAWDATESKNF